MGSQRIQFNVYTERQHRFRKKSRSLSLSVNALQDLRCASEYKQTLKVYSQITSAYFYRPQTKFAKVMFLHMSVCPRGGEYLGRYTTTPPRAGTPPLGRYTPPGRYPPLPQCMLGYGQQAGGTHPTGMHSCFFDLCRLILEKANVKCEHNHLFP